MRCEWNMNWEDWGTGLVAKTWCRCLMDAEPGKRLCAFHAPEEEARVGALRQAFGRQDGPCLPKNIKIPGAGL